MYATKKAMFNAVALDPGGSVVYPKLRPEGLKVKIGRVARKCLDAKTYGRLEYIQCSIATPNLRKHAVSSRWLKLLVRVSVSGVADFINQPSTT